jgi:hypothetical protein
MSSTPALTSSKLMGGWVIDMGDLDAAHAVIDACRSELQAILEVRHTLWGVQVRTDSDDAADYVASHYGEPAGAPQVFLAA